MAGELQDLVADQEGAETVPLGDKPSEEVSSVVAVVTEALPL